MQKHFSMDFACEQSARSFMSTFRETPTLAKDRDGIPLRIYAVQDRSMEERKKLGRFSPLFDLTRTLLTGKGTWDESKFKLGSSTSLFYVNHTTPSAESWVFFELRNNVVVANLSDLARWNITETEANKMIASLPAP